MNTFPGFTAGSALNTVAFARPSAMKPQESRFDFIEPQGVGKCALVAAGVELILLPTGFGEIIGIAMGALIGACCEAGER